MKSLLALPLVLLGISTAAFAQSPAADRSSASLTSTGTVGDIAMPSDSFGATPDAVDATPATLPRAQEPLQLALAAPRPSLAALSFATPATAAIVGVSEHSSPASPAADPSPAPPAPPYGFNERDYNLEIALGVSVIRFRSSVYTATGVGFHPAVAFFFKDWLAVEGAISTGFAPTIYSAEHVKILTYGAGPKISLGRRRIEPWVHVLAGGIHALPQTALGGRNGFR